MADGSNEEAADTAVDEVTSVEVDPVVLVLKRNSTTVVWKYFGFHKDDVEQKNTKCKVCLKTVVTTQSNASNLYHHLEHNHAVEFEDVRKAQSSKQGSRSATPRQQPITEAFAGATPYERTSKRWIEITNAIAYHIAKDMAPIVTFFSCLSSSM